MLAVHLKGTNPSRQERQRGCSPSTQSHLLDLLLIVYKITEILIYARYDRPVVYIVPVTHRKLKHCKLFYKSNTPHFLSVYRFTGVITHLGCWENTRKACKSLAFGWVFTNFSRVLPASRVGYYTGKPIESGVYCFIKLNPCFFHTVRACSINNKPFITYLEDCSSTAGKLPQIRHMTWTG